MAFPFWLLALPLYVAWLCLGHIPQLATPAGTAHRMAHLGVVLGSVGLLVPGLWLVLHTLLPAAPPVGLAVWLSLLLWCGLHPLTVWLRQQRPVATLRRWLLWVADAGVLLCVVSRWL